METNTTQGDATVDINNYNPQAADFNLLSGAWNLEELKSAAIQLRLPRPRSLAWAIMLHTIPSNMDGILKSIRCHRNFYIDLKSKLSMDPRAVIDDDPLSQNEESAWKQHFCDNELKALIMQDVVRTYPEEAYFREKGVQDMMVCVLFLWARSHTAGYRQGMHELLAPLMLERTLDAEHAPTHLSPTLKEYLDETYLEHDSYMLFNDLMKGVERFYTTGDVVPLPSGRMPVSRTTHNPNEVVRYLERVREEFLVPLDPELASHLSNCGISMELFGIRWLRLLFGREFPRTEIPHLWGFLLAGGPHLPHLHYVIAAILLAHRDTLMQSESGRVLAALMRPSAASAGHVCRLALHLARPLQYPPPPAHTMRPNSPERQPEPPISDAGPVDETDVARELATLGVIRAQLPSAAAALKAALPRPTPLQAQALHHVLRLASLVQNRNHALTDVETALEAAEQANAQMDKARRNSDQKIRPMTPVRLNKFPSKVREVPLKVFSEVECESTSDLPCLDPLRLRTD